MPASGENFGLSISTRRRRRRRGQLRGASQGPQGRSDGRRQSGISCGQPDHRGSEGSLDLHAKAERDLSVHERQLAALCAARASNILTTANHDTTESQRFDAALGARRAIHQAQGVIMTRDNVSENEALVRIMKAARTRHVTALAYFSEIVKAFHDPGQPESEPSP